MIHAWSGLWNIWFSPADIEREGHYWPVVYTSFWLEHKLWGPDPRGYHAVNVLLHLVNVLLIWRLLLLLRLAAPGAWVVAAVFAVHPLHVESVAWVIERKDVLSALFYLTAVLTWMRFVEAPRPGRYALALGLFTAGLLSKSIVVTLPAALLIWHWWRAGRVTRTDLTRLAPFFAVALVVTALDLSFYTSREPLSLGYSLVERVLIAARALWFYVGKLLWPTDLAVIYPLWEIRAADPVAWSYVLGAAGLAAGLWAGRRRLGRGPLAGALFFAVTLSPTLGFVDYGYMQFSLVADRFQYLAGLGVLAVLLGAATDGACRLPGGLRRGAAAGLVVVLAVLGALTWRQAGVYRDGITLFSHIVALNPDARDAHLNLVGPLADAGRYEEALAAARTGVARRPDSADAHSNVGRVLVLMERLDEAERVLRTALELAPRHAHALQNLGEALRKGDRYEEAAELYRRALDSGGDSAPGHAGLGLSLFATERYGDALEALERALALDPGAPSADQLSLFAGRAARHLGRLDEAGAHLRRAAALAPDSAEPLTELSALLFAERRPDEAGEYLRRAHELRPGDPAVFHNAAEALRNAGRLDEALASYRDALRLEPDLAPAHVGIGAALVDLERHEEALESLARSLPLEMDPETEATAPLSDRSGPAGTGSDGGGGGALRGGPRARSASRAGAGPPGSLAFRAAGVRACARAVPGSGGAGARRRRRSRQHRRDPLLPGAPRGSAREHRTRAAARPGPRHGAQARRGAARGHLAARAVARVCQRLARKKLRDVAPVQAAFTSTSTPRSCRRRRRRWVTRCLSRSARYRPPRSW